MQKPAWHTFLHLAAEHTLKDRASCSQDSSVGMQCSALNRYGGVCEQLLLIHGLHGGA